MPDSFWIFLIICIASFVVAIDDHGEEWHDFKKACGARKWWKGIKIVTLWFVCVGSFIGTLVLGWESKQGDAQYGELTNKLARVTSKYDLATNELGVVLRQINEITNNATKNNPSNRPLSSVSAHLFLVIKGTNALAFNPEKNFRDRLSCELLVGKIEKLKSSKTDNILWDLTLSCVAATSQINGKDPITIWILRFDQNAGYPNHPVTPLYGRDISQWDTLEIDLLFLPSGTLVLTGEITFSAGLLESKKFSVQRQVIEPILKPHAIPTNTVSILGNPAR